MITANEMIKLAEGELGYIEKASNSKLDDKTANSGSANYTKYGRDLAAAGFFNGSKNGYAWCAQFVVWCAYKLCGTREKAERLLCISGDLAAGCGYAMRYYQSAGRFDNEPRPGDQIFFRYGESGVDHTGLVAKVTDTHISTIEGNSNDQVRRRSYERSDPTILGYGHPRYEQEENTVNIKLNVLRKGSTGDQVKALQRILRDRGWHDAEGKRLKADGDFGDKTEQALRKLQKKKKLTVDGVCGEATWRELLGVK